MQRIGNLTLPFPCRFDVGIVGIANGDANLSFCSEQALLKICQGIWHRSSRKLSIIFTARMHIDFCSLPYIVIGLHSVVASASNVSCGKVSAKRRMRHFVEEEVSAMKTVAMLF